MTPNIASVTSSASNANGSASAFLFAAASEPEAAFSVPFPEAYARRTTTERQSQTIHIDPPPRALLSPPPQAPTNPPSRAARLVAFECASSRARARAFASISHLCRLPPARGCAHTDATRSHLVSLRTHPSSPPPPRARLSSSLPNDRLVPSRPRSRPRAHRASSSTRVGTAPPRTRGHIARTFTRTVPRTRARDRRLTLRRARHDSSSSRAETSSSAGASFPSTLRIQAQP